MFTLSIKAKDFPKVGINYKIFFLKILRKNGSITVARQEQSSKLIFTGFDLFITQHSTGLGWEGYGQATDTGTRVQIVYPGVVLLH